MLSVHICGMNADPSLDAKLGERKDRATLMVTAERELDIPRLG
jgi:hypothetical protein